MPFAWQLVQHSLAEIGGDGALRRNGDGLFVTSYGSLVLDTKFDPAINAKTLNEQLNAIPGIVEHGIFAGLTTAVYCGKDGVVEEYRP